MVQMVTILIINNIANTNMSNLSTMNGRKKKSGTITTISVLRRRKKRKNQVRQMIIQNQKRKYQQLTTGNLLIANQMRRRLPSEFSKLMNLGLYNKLALENPRK